MFLALQETCFLLKHVQIPQIFPSGGPKTSKKKHFRAFHSKLGKKRNLKVFKKLKKNEISTTKKRNFKVFEKVQKLGF